MYRGLRSELNLLEDSDFGIINKKEIVIMADFVKKNFRKNNKNKNYNRKNDYVTPPQYCHDVIEYKMSKLMAEDILRDADKSLTPQEALCEFVNTQMGLKGFCVKVFVENK